MFAQALVFVNWNLEKTTGTYFRKTWNLILKTALLKKRVMLLYLSALCHQNNFS